MNRLAPHVVASIHAYLLIIIGVWAFFDTGSKAQFLLVILGVPILTMNNGVRYSDKSSTRVALFFTIAATVVAGIDTLALWSSSSGSRSCIVSLTKSGILLFLGAVSTVVLLGALRRVAKV